MVEGETAPFPDARKVWFGSSLSNKMSVNTPVVNYTLMGPYSYERCQARGSLLLQARATLVPLLAAPSPALICCVLIHCSNEKLNMKRVWQRKSSLW